MVNLKEYIQEKGSLHLFILIITQVIFLVAFGIYILIDQQFTFDQDSYKWAVLIVFCVSEIYYAYHSVLQYLQPKVKDQNILELFAFVFIQFCTTSSSALRFFYIYTSQEHLAVKIFAIIYISYSILVFIIGMFACNELYHQFKFQIFQKVGASAREQKKYQYLTNFKCLMELNAQLTILIQMTFFYFIDKNNDRTVNWNLIYIDLGVSAVAILTFAFGYTGVRDKKKRRVYIYLISLLIIIGYEIYKIYLLLKDDPGLISNNTLDWASYTTVIIILSSSVVIFMTNLYYGIQYLQLKKDDSLISQS
ncbi:hypothetical protein pb186bvf_003057 [Paramecium bursaria]